LSNFLTNLVSHWNLDEALDSDDAADAHGSNTLPNATTIAAGTGKISGCRTFVASESDYFAINDNADMSVAANTSFTFTAWVKLATKTAVLGVLGKFNTSDEYGLYYTNATDRFRFDIVGSNISATSFGSPSTATWYFIACGYDSPNTDVWISVNAGTRDSANDANGTTDDTNQFTLGTLRTGAFYFDGDIDHVSFWKGRVISDAELAELYNAGNGLAYASYAGSSDAVPVCWASYRRRRSG
jgi:hypothetical protein